MDEYNDDFEDQSHENCYGEAFDSFDLVDTDSMLKLGMPVDSLMEEIQNVDEDDDDVRFIFPNEIGVDGDDDKNDEVSENDMFRPRFMTSIEEEDDGNIYSNSTLSTRNRILRQQQQQHYNNNHQQQQQHRSNAGGYKGKEYKQQRKTSPPLPNRREEMIDIGSYGHKMKRVQIDSGSGGGAPGARGQGVSSTITKLITHDSTMLQKQLRSALKKLQLYSKEKEKLNQRLDSSAIEAELEKLRLIIADQESEIARLHGETRGLQQVTRHQGKRLAAVEDKNEREGAPEQAMSTEKQVVVLLERVKRQSIVISKGAEKMRGLMQENVSLKRQQDEQSTRQSASRQQQPINEERDAAVEPESCAPVFNDTRSDENLRVTIARLQKSLVVQRAGFQSEIFSLRADCERMVVHQEALEGELAERERQARAQLLNLRQLKKSYEELSEGNRQLMLASEIYAQQGGGGSGVSVSIQGQHNQPLQQQHKVSPPKALPPPSRPIVSRGSKQARPKKKGPVIVASTDTSIESANFPGSTFITNL